jgi:hypothetical protein
LDVIAGLRLVHRFSLRRCATLRAILSPPGTARKEEGQRVPAAEQRPRPQTARAMKS